MIDNRLKNMININAENIDGFVNKAVGLSGKDELLCKMKEKTKSRYFVTTQNKNRCIEKCGHCFMIEDMPGTGSGEQVLKKNDIQYLMEKYKNADFKTYMYYQEPYIVDHYFENLKKYKQETSEINPALFIDNPELIKKIKKAGLKEIKHSIHGNAEFHTEFTSSSYALFEKKIKGIELLKKENIRVGIESTFFSDNVKFIPYLYDLMVNLKVDDWIIGRVIPVGRAASWAPEKFLRKEKAFDAMSRIYELKAKSTAPNIKIESVWGVNFYDTWIYRYLLGTAEREPVKSSYYCDAVNTHMYYSSISTGSVFPCFYLLNLPEYKMGNWNKTAGDIEIDKNAIEKWSEESLKKNLTGICSEEACLFFSLCLGGCRVEAIAFGSYDQHNDPFFDGMDFCITNEISKRLNGK